MLVIRGDTRIADIHFGEYMRIFDDHYARYVVRLLQTKATATRPMGAWLPSHFDAASPKASAAAVSSACRRSELRLARLELVDVLDERADLQRLREVVR
jgi:hypothetical protein